MRRSALIPAVSLSLFLCLFAGAVPSPGPYVSSSVLHAASLPDDDPEAQQLPSGESAMDAYRAALSDYDPETEQPSSDGSGTDAVLVIDVSGSMKNSDPDYLCRSAAENFIDELSFTPGSRAALITFSDTLQTVIPLTSLDNGPDREALVNEISSLSYTAGDTDIGTALEKAASFLADDNDSRAKCIFLLTDGEIDLPAAPDEEAAEKESLTKALMTVEEAKADGIVIHTVALDLSGGMDKNLMHYLADSTGGTANLIDSASALDEVFRLLSLYAARQQPMSAETESEPLTEAMTEEETETETEEQAAPMVFAIGSVDGPVRLKGLFPNLCSARLRLSDLFRLEGRTSGLQDAIRYTAYPDDNSLLKCTVEDDTLVITGLRNGAARVQVIAEPADTGSEMNQADLSFTVEVHALIPSLWYLAIIPAAGLIIFLLIRVLSGRRGSASQLSGSLQWFVRGENEKIFGMPGQTMADLSDYGSRVRLSELVSDELLAGVPLEKVIITPWEEGIAITSKNASCLIAASGCAPSRRLELTGSGRFKVFCETGRGKAAIIAMYASDSEYKAEPSFEDDSGERTRLLV